MKDKLIRAVLSALAGLAASVAVFAGVAYCATSGIYDPSIPFAALLTLGGGFMAGREVWRRTA